MIIDSQEFKEIVSLIDDSTEMPSDIKNQVIPTEEFSAPQFSERPNAEEIASRNDSLPNSP